MFSKLKITKSIKNYSEQIVRLKEELNTAETVIIGAGAGLSTAAGFDYNGERFRKYFSDFEAKYSFHDMYSGGFYPYETLEEYWAYWSRYIYINRYMNPPKPVYNNLFELVQNKDYFVLTTNVDHCFQKAGFDKRRLFYTQGDYGLFQCRDGCDDSTYDNQAVIRKMVEAQGFVVADGTLTLPKNTSITTVIPSEMIPHCPKCGAPMTMNLRTDDTFIEDAGWHLAAERYADFLRRHQNTRTLFLELGTGYHTPSIVKYGFWRMTVQWRNATYVCINWGGAEAPRDIKHKSICINEDIGAVLEQI